MKGYSLVCAGGVGNATGANFLLRTPDVRILVDCGLVQGSRFAQEENREAFPYAPEDVSYLLITHAHMDHIGRIPKLVKEGFKGTIYSTAETKELAAIMLQDAFMLLTREAKETNQEPLYGQEDIGRALSLWKTVKYHEKLDLTPKISIFAKDSGHILGSVIFEMTIADQNERMKIAFTGDLGNSPTPLLRDTEYVTDADYMVIESVYGDRNHGPKDVRDRRFKEIIAETLKKGGTVVIPTFSIERTQVILYELNAIVESKSIPAVPIFLDSPLALKVTAVYEQHIEDFNEKVQKEIRGGDDVFDFPGLRIVKDRSQSEQVNNIKGPKIIISGSGMSVGGRVIHHERFFLGDPNATILLVGYQVPGSLGRQIEEKVPVLRVDGAMVKLRARIEKISGFSSHKDSDGLVEFVSHALPQVKKIFVAMGENKSSTFLAQRLRDELGANAVVPEKDREYLL